MVQENTDNDRAAFTVTVDHISAGTGISAADRTVTVRALAGPSTAPADLRRPGHIFPLRARPGGVLKRAGHTEASTDLLALTGHDGVAAITELVGDDGVPLHGAQIPAFAAAHHLPFLRIEDLVRLRRRTSSLITRTGQASLPLNVGGFRAASFRSQLDGAEHLALVHGDIAAAGSAPDGVLVRVHRLTRLYRIRAQADCSQCPARTSSQVGHPVCADSPVVYKTAALPVR